MKVWQLAFILVLFMLIGTVASRRCKNREPGCRAKVKKETVCLKINETGRELKYKGLFVREVTCLNNNGKAKVDKYCEVDGKRYEIGETFMDPARKCKHYTCRNRRRPKHYRRERPGCIMDGVCHKIGEKWEKTSSDGLFLLHATCIVKRSKGGIVTFTDIDADCKSNDGWKKSGEVWRVNCTDYKCIVNSNKTSASASIMPSVEGCYLNGTCIPNDKTWEDGCTTMVCDVQGLSAHQKIETHRCDFMNKCRNHDEEWVTSSCTRLRCTVSGNNASTEIVAQGCKLENGTCVEDGVTWEEGCTTMVCEIDGNKAKQAIHTLRCVSEDKKCRNIMETWDEDCITKICNQINETTTQIAPHAYKCDLNGSCKSVGDTWWKGCELRECADNGGNTLKELQCETPDGNCIPHDGTYTNEDTCAKIVCKINGNTATHDVVETFCPDVQTGKCAKDGEYVVMKSADDKLLNCTCQTGIKLAQGKQCRLI